MLLSENALARFTAVPANTLPPDAVTVPVPKALLVPTVNAPLTRLTPPLNVPVPVSASPPVPVLVNAPVPVIALPTVRLLVPCTVRPPAPSATPLLGARVRPAAVASSVPPLAVMVLPNCAALANCNTPPLSALLAKLLAPPTDQVPLLTRKLPKLMYCAVLNVPVPVLPLPVPTAEFCRISVLFPPRPPSTTPVCAKLSKPPGPSNSRARPPALLTLPPVTAVKLLVLPAPIETLPLMVPELTNVLPVAEL